MNDEKLKQGVQEAFGSLHRPDDLDSRTLEFIKLSVGSSKESSEKREPVAVSVRVNKGFRGFALKAMAACLALTLVGVGSWNAYFVPVAYADVESGAGVELTVNRFDRVVGASSLDDAGQAALDELHGKGIDLCGMSYEEALASLMGASAYAESDDSAVQVTIACNDQERAHKMQQASEQCTGQRKMACSSTSMEEHQSVQGAHEGMHAYAQESSESAECDGQGNGYGNGAHDGTGAGNGNGHKNQGEHNHD